MRSRDLPEGLESYFNLCVNKTIGHPAYGVGLSRGEALDFCSGRARFESQTGHRLSRLRFCAPQSLQANTYFYILSNSSPPMYHQHSDAIQSRY
jgi:hypothetical protein